MYITFHAAPAINDLLQTANERHGYIHRLRLDGGFGALEPAVFERVSFLCGSIDSIEITELLSPQQQSEIFVRNCMSRGVRVLKAARKVYDAETIPKGLSDVSEDTILHFCFRRSSSRPAEQCFGYGERCCPWHTKGTEADVELWLNYVDLSENFLQRFVQASDDSGTDHRVRLFLCGENLDKLDASGSVDEYEDWEGVDPKCYYFRRKSCIWVRTNAHMKYIVILRCPLQEAPPENALDDEHDNFMSFHRPWRDGSSYRPKRKLSFRIRISVDRFIYRWFHY